MLSIRHWLAILLIGSLPAALAPSVLAEEPTRDDLDAARALLLRGRYEEAADAYRKWPASPEAVIGLARTLLAEGDSAAAVKRLMEGVANDEKSAPLHAELAIASLETGQTKLADEESAAALAIDADCLAARYVVAVRLKQRGKLAEAEKAFGWFIDRQRQLATGGKKIDADSLLWIGKAAAEHARWTRNHRLFSSLVNDLYPAALRADENFWPAHLHSALLFHEKYNEPAALAAIEAGLAINPSSADLHAAKAALAVRSFDVRGATTSLERCRELNPRHVWASQLAADIEMINTNPAKAIELLEKALELRPGDEETLGRLLACYAASEGGDVEKPSEQMRKVMDLATEQNPHCGEFFLAAGDALDQMRRYGQAVSFYREAHRRMPQLISARSQLGLTLMRMGEEQEAAKILEEAFDVDPFHVRVKNTLEVLDLLQGYAVIETEHFVVKFDRGQDELLARYAADHLENEVYPQVVKTLGYAPPDKTLFEIFSRARNTSGHGWFSARMAGVPSVGTVGACAGKMVGITTPRELPKKYNWAKVLGHEFVHVVNLQQTNFNVPHWLTEGIAVHLEDQPRPDDWNQLLARRAKADKLFNLDDILFGFVRPQQREDWTLAYCQAELYVDYARERFGEGAIARLLAAYAERLSTPDALSRAYGVSQGDFERGYREFVDRIVAEQMLDEASSTEKLDDLLAAAAENPEDAGAAAKLAHAYLDRDNKPNARKWAEKALGLEPDQPEANYVLAQLQLSIGGGKEALELLTKAVSAPEPYAPAVALLAGIKLQQEEYDEAEKWYRLGEEKFPKSDRWAKGLARIYLKRGESEKLRPVLVKLAERDPDSLAMRKKLAQLALAADDFEEGRRWAREAMHLDVEDAEAHALLGQALLRLDRLDEAIAELEVAVKLDDGQSQWKQDLGRARSKRNVPKEDNPKPDPTNADD